MSENDEPSSITESEQDEELISRSQIKREMHALQKLAERLIGLKPGQWSKLGFGSVMMAALEESTRIKNHIAIRRHIKRVGKLLNNEDTEKLDQLFARMDDKDFQDKAGLQRLEQWRERLLTEGDKALQVLLDDHPKADRQQLRQLIRAGRKERETESSGTAQRKLFKYIKELEGFLD